MSIPNDSVLATQKAICFRGLVRVPLCCLQFEHQLFLDKHREECPQNVRRLQKIFEKTGCLRLQDENVVDAVVRDDYLDTALRKTGLTIEDLHKIRSPKDAPTVHFESLQCLNGLHRIRAADRFLNENDKWWVVRLFSSETPASTLCHIIESYSNEEKPSDGEVFRRIRLCHRENDIEEENKWWARLNYSKPKDLRQLCRRKELVSGFDRLVDMPGLWSKVQLGALHRLLALKCDEEMIHYLKRILHVWTKILTCNTTTLPFSAVDAATVENLESLAPKHSAIDKTLVLDLMDRKILFPSQIEPHVRRELADNICASEGLIPSLWTFFETLKYIEPICEALRKLVGSNMKRTIRSSFMAHYFPPDKRNIQVANFREAKITSEFSQEAVAQISYVEMWAFCARNFNKLTSFTPKKESGESKPVVEGPNPVLWKYLATFSLSRGFMTKRAQDLSKSDPHTELALEYLRKSSPLFLSSCSQKVQEIVRASQALEDPPQLQTPVAFNYIERERRNGRPYENDLHMDQQNLYLPNIYNNEEPAEANWTLIRRDLFNSLFGNLSIQHTEVEHSMVAQGSSTDTDLMDVDGGDPDTPEEMQGLLTQLEALRSDHSSLLSQHKNLQARNEELISENVTFKEGLQALKNQDNANTALISSLRSDIQVLHTRNAELMQAKTACEQKCHELERQKNKNADKISSFQLSIQELQHLRLENTKLKENNNELQIAATPNIEEMIKSHPIFVRMQEESRALETERMSLQRKIGLLEEHSSKLIQDNQKYLTYEKAYGENLQALTQERDGLLSQRGDLIAQTVSAKSVHVDPKQTFIMALREKHFHHTWQAHTGHDYEIFLAESNDISGLLRGTSCIVSRDELIAIQTIVALLEGAKAYFGEEPRAVNIHGKFLSSITPTFIFTALTMNETIFVGSADVLERHVLQATSQQVAKLVQGSQRHMIEEAEGTKKRRLDDGYDSTEVFRKGEENLSGGREDERFLYDDESE